MKHTITALLLISAAIAGYYFGQAGSKGAPEPAWACYSRLWGDLDAMRAHHLEGLSAKEVYEYCVKTTHGEPAEPVLTVLKSTQPLPTLSPLPPIVKFDCDCSGVQADCALKDQPEPAFLHEEIPATHR